MATNPPWSQLLEELQEQHAEADERSLMLLILRAIQDLDRKWDHDMTELSQALADLQAADAALPARITDAINRAVADALAQLGQAQSTIAELQAHNASDDDTIAADAALLADLQAQVAGALSTVTQVTADLNAQVPEPPVEPTA